MNDGAVVWALRLAVASTAVLLVPGISVLLAWRPRPRLSVVEAISLGCGVSFGLVQLLTIVAMLLHRSLGEMLAVLGIVTALHLGVFLARRPRMRITATRGEWLLLASFGVVAAGAYLRGSPFGDVEDYIHIALVRRLISLPHPALADIYFIPHVIYTYPFPGTHYAMALVAQVGGLDPLFLYHKFRGFLVFPALAAVYAFTKVFFGSRRIALVAAFTAVAFVVNGTFGMVSGLFWGGLAPFSHTSDIAMAVLLPTQLVVCGHFLRARGLRAEAFFGSTAVLLTTVLMISHTREVVQLLVYLASSAVAFMLVGASRRVQRHAWTLVVLSTALVVVYVQWHASTVTAVTGLVASMRPDLAKLIEGEGIRMLAGNPDSVLGPYIRSFALLFHGWTPFALLAGPAVLYAHRRRRLAVFIGASVLAYLLIIRVPLLGAAYIWGTYFEILFTPVRNVIFFVYVLSGVAIYTIASRLARMTMPLAVVSGAATALAAVVVYRFAEPLFTRHNDLFFVPAIAGYALLAVLLIRQRTRATNLHPSVPPWFVAAALVVAVAALTFVPDGTPMRVNVAEVTNTPAALMATFRCEEIGGVPLPFAPPDVTARMPMVPAMRRCPPTDAVLRFINTRTPVDAVFAVDKFGGFPLPLLVARRVAFWPATNHVFRDEDKMFPVYFDLYRDSIRKHLAQPFFNDRDTAAERADFVHRLQVTHVLVDPLNYAMMTPVLQAHSELFHPVFDQDHWAVYEVAG